MLPEALTALASLAGRTVVAAAVTDAWDSARHGFARLLGHGDEQQEQLAGRRLEETRRQLAGADPAEVRQVSEALAGRWAVRLADLLEEDPGAEAGLRALVREIQAAMPAAAVSAADHAVAAGGDVNVHASQGGVAAAVIHGNVAPPDPTGRGPARG